MEGSVPVTRAPEEVSSIKSQSGLTNGYYSSALWALGVVLQKESWISWGLMFQAVGRESHSGIYKSESTDVRI